VRVSKFPAPPSSRRAKLHSSGKARSQTGGLFFSFFFFPFERTGHSHSLLHSAGAVLTCIGTSSHTLALPCLALLTMTSSNLQIYTALQVLVGQVTPDGALIPQISCCRLLAMNYVPSLANPCLSGLFGLSFLSVAVRPYASPTVSRLYFSRFRFVHLLYNVPAGSCLTRNHNGLSFRRWGVKRVA
jgi:hypothetical protein